MNAHPKRKWWLIVLAALVLSGAGGVAGRLGVFSSQGLELGEAVTSWSQARDLTGYDLDMTLKPREEKASAVLEVDYVNHEVQDMDSLHFLLYANSYSSQDYRIFELDDMQLAYPNGFSPGSIDILSVQVEGQDAEYTLSGQQKHVLEVTLPRSVEPGQHICLTISYELTIPNCYGRFGYGQNTMSLVNCTPVLAVYDYNGWHDYPFYPIGDLFYTEVADYEASIVMPTGYELAATGLVSARWRGNTTTWQVNAPARRDFGLVVSWNFHTLEKTTESGVTVRSYYLPGNQQAGQTALDTACQALTYYEQRFGIYPYGAFSVVQTDFFIGGMEYPGLVLIDGDMYAQGMESELKMVVAHETAHMWWYAVVGSDQVYEPWLDEALTDYSTRQFIEAFGSEEERLDQRELVEAMKQFRLSEVCGVNLPVMAYEDGLHYSSWVYYRGADVMEELEDKLGSAAFDKSLRAYYFGNRLGLVDRDTFEYYMSRDYGTDISAWLDDAFAHSE